MAPVQLPCGCSIFPREWLLRSVRVQCLVQVYILTVLLFATSSLALYLYLLVGSTVSITTPNRDILRPTQLPSHSRGRGGDCLHSSKGPWLLVDSNGVICHREDMNWESGCCAHHSGLEDGAKGSDCARCCRCDSANDMVHHSTTGTGVVAYKLEQCGSEKFAQPLREGFGCCPSLEECIACCIRHQPKENFIQMELYHHCVAQCRVSSCSIYHQKTYALPDTRHCFGDVSLVLRRHMKDQHIIEGEEGHHMCREEMRNVERSGRPQDEYRQGIVHKSRTRGSRRKG